MSVTSRQRGGVPIPGEPHFTCRVERDGTAVWTLHVDGHPLALAPVPLPTLEACLADLAKLPIRLRRAEATYTPDHRWSLVADSRELAASAASAADAEGAREAVARFRAEATDALVDTLLERPQPARTGKGQPKRPLT